MDFELEELAGASCVHSGKKILVATDATHCTKCGRAVLQKHKDEHESKCSGAGAIKRVAHDYDEEPPVEWTTKVIGFVATGVFVAALGGGLMMASPEQPPGELAKPMPTKKLGAGFGLMALGAVVGVAGFSSERKKQLAKK